jgi:hypothetical protein
MEAGGAINAIVVEQRHCRHLQLARALDEFFRLRCAVKKAESARGV